MNGLPYDYRNLREELEGSGWLTPQTYCNCFDSPGEFSAVYVFLLVDPLEFKSALPAYVGMSKNLLQRWSGHPILRSLSDSDLWVQRWFLKVQEENLRSVEGQYIRKFNPPWNISGKVRGVILQ